MTPRVPGRVVLFGACLGLSGCVLLHSPSTGTAGLDGLPQLRLPRDESATSRVIVWRSPGEYDEYQRVTGPASRAEAIYLEANGIETALDFSVFDLESLTRRWSFNAGHALVWQPMHTQEKDGYTLRYAGFVRDHERTTATVPCAAFIAAWDVPVDDPLRRPARALFGYVCGATASGPAQGDYLERLHVRPEETPRVLYGQRVPHDAAARRTVDAAYPGFPLARARSYNTADRHAGGH